MRGIIFSEFLEFVEDQSGPEMVEHMIESCELDSGGAYTRVGTYDHREMLAMLAFLHRTNGAEVSTMLTSFGRHLFGQLAQTHRHLVGDPTNLLDFLEGIETHIHSEVQKLYPGHELPFFRAERPRRDRLVPHYSSPRPLADLAHGMLMGASDWFAKPLSITRTDPTPPATAHTATFDIALA